MPPGQGRGTRKKLTAAERDCARRTNPSPLGDCNPSPLGDCARRCAAAHSPTRSPRGPLQSLVLKLRHHHRASPRPWPGVLFNISLTRKRAFGVRLLLNKKASLTRGSLFVHALRRGGDSNPRYDLHRTTVFETAGLDHSPTSPQTVFRKKSPTFVGLAVRTRLELATSGVTGRHSNQTELPHHFPFGIANIDTFF